MKKNSIIAYIVLFVILAFAFVPIIMMLFMSLKDTVTIYGDFWAPPVPPKWGNYSSALLDNLPAMMNSIIISSVTALCIVALGSISGYVFARLEFLGKEFLFYLIIILLMIPGVLTLTPNFILATKLGLRNNWFGLWFFYIAGGQVFAIFLMRTFFASQPSDIFDSARIDGASELQCIWNIAVPLARPSLITIGIMNFLGTFNDLIWPLLIISDRKKETLMMALQHYNPNVQMIISRPDIGIQTAAYAFACLPILLVFILGMRYYIEGITAGALKA